MDKKKVKELVDQIRTCLYNATGETDDDNTFINMSIHRLGKIDEELSKSDWISVEDGLPEFGEMVYVRSVRSPHLIQTHREDFDEDDGKFHPFRDKNKFVLEQGIYGTITHWKPIEKLEE